MASKQGQSKKKLKGATTESKCSQQVTKKTLGTTRAGRPSKLAAVVYEDDKVLEDMDMSDSEEIDPGESLFKKQKKNLKRKASTPNKQRQVNLDTSADVSPVKTPRKPKRTPAEMPLSKSPRATKSQGKSPEPVTISDMPVPAATHTEASDTGVYIIFAAEPKSELIPNGCYNTPEQFQSPVNIRPSLSDLKAENSSVMPGSQAENAEEAEQLLGHYDPESSNGNAVEKKQKLSMTRHQLFTIVLLAVSSMCASMFGSLIAPFFPQEAEKKGMSQTMIGLLFGCYQLIGFILSPVFGAYITKIGGKFMYVAGIFVNSSSAILFGSLQWCPPGSVYIIMCFVTRTIEAVGAAAIGTACRAIASFYLPQHVSTVMGILSACGCVGLMIGPPVGGLLYEIGGFFLPCLVTGSCFMACGFINCCFMPAINMKATAKEEKRNNSVVKVEENRAIPKWHLLRLPVICVTGYVVFVGQMAIGLIDVALSLHVQDVQPSLSQGHIGLIFLAAPLIVVICAPLLGSLADKFRVLQRPFLISGLAFGTLGFLGLGPSPVLIFMPQHSLPVLIVSMCTIGVGWGALVLTYEEFVSAARVHGFPDGLETQGLVSGVYSAFNNLGAFIGPIAGGFINERLNFPWSSTLNAIMIASAGVTMTAFWLLEHCLCPPPTTVISIAGHHGNHDSKQGYHHNSTQAEEIIPLSNTR